MQQNLFSNWFGNRVTVFLAISAMFLCSNAISFAQEIRRYQFPVFSTIDSSVNIQYGEAVNIKGEKEKLLLDIFAPPSTDTLKKRPLMIFIHGGGFQNNSKTGAFSNAICTGLARSGYLTASIDYRLGVGNTKTNTDYLEAMYRAVQDGKAAVRFFRRYAEKYGIDTGQIFVMGSSAGAKTAMHLAYLDQDEVPSLIDVNKMGTLEGNSGNPGYASNLQGVVNCWGAMIDYKWINAGDPPMMNVSGTADKTVPFDSSFGYHGFKYGSLILYERMLSVGIATGWRPFYNTGHTLDNNKEKQDSAFQDIAQWLFTRLTKNKPDRPEVFKWEAAIRKLEQLDATEKYTSDAVLLVGSSYIRLWANMKTDLLKPYETINRGFGGSKLSDVAYYIKRLVYPHQFKAIVLYVGNDIVGSNLDKTPLQDLELVKYITKTIREKYPTVPIFWNQISPSEKRWAVWDKISEANTLIKNYCAQNSNTYFIEIADAYLGKDGKPITKYFREDKLHYNEAGYKVWAGILKATLK
jgi:pimeloyl-ACP methyl ester carboxylesterase/lysophospholipase L1-like esterase